MAALYNASPFAGPPPMLLPGVNAYSYGGYNDRVPATRMLVTNVALTTNVVTLTVQITAGNIPVVGALITIKGTKTANNSSGSLNFNQVNASLTGVTIDSVTGAGTVTFALTASNVASIADAGVALVPQPETADTLTASTAGQQFAMQAVSGLASNSRDISWDVRTPSAPSTFTANLQVADIDLDAQYTTVDTATAVGQRTIIGIRANFVRGQISAVSGGSSPTVIFKILV